MNGSEDSVTAEESFWKPAPDTARRIIYFNIIRFAYWHVAGLYGLYLAVTSATWATIVLACLMLMAGDIGVTAGAHRLWSHKSYRARLPLRVLLMLFQSVAFQNSVLNWARDHRMHHRFCDTDADPHNSKRGLFFSHIGWLLVRRHPQLLEQGKHVDLADLHADPVLQFQKKYAIPVIGAMSFAIPTLLPLTWGETLTTAYHVNLFRIIFGLNATFLVNSAAHKWGCRVYDKTITSTQSWLLSFLVLGEGYHNFHHVFPWDYRTAELGNPYNLTAKFIEFCARLGWAYDLKTVPQDVVRRRALRTGDGSHPYMEEADSNAKVLCSASKNYLLKSWQQNE